MTTFLMLTAILLKISALFAPTKGKALRISEEFSVYAGQNLTLSCFPRDSPLDFVFWYKVDENNKEEDRYHSDGPSYTITMATVDDRGIYSCLSAEWGTWGIRRYSLVNVIVPGEQSCKHGWHLHKKTNACYLHSARSVTKSWSGAQTYCNAAEAQLAHFDNNAEDLAFLTKLFNKTSPSSFWLDYVQGAHGTPNWSMPSGTQASQCSVFNKTVGILSRAACSKLLPFVCQRVLPAIPRGVHLEYITSFTARVGWTVTTSRPERQAYHVELTAAFSKKVVTRTSSKSRSVTFTHLQPDTMYQVRVQAENGAGNGSSSSFVEFKTKASPPIIVSSLPNGTVSAGQPLKLRCAQARASISWYKQGSDKPIAHGQELTIREASSSHEGTYYCAPENGSESSIYVSVITPPVITNLTCAMLNHEIIFLCETSNKHRVEYAWLKDEKPLLSKTDTMKVPLRNNIFTGLYECRVSNMAGRASKSLIVAPLGKTVDPRGSTHPSGNDSVAVYITVIAVLSFILAIFCFACGIFVRTGRLKFGKKRTSRKLTTQSSLTEITAVELTASEDSESPRIVLHSSDSATENREDVFPYLVTQAWLPGNGHYSSLRRDERADRNVTDVTQTMKPDYVNISPSNRNDSAANCMYAPLVYPQGDADKTKRPYVNTDDNGSCDM
ncbi:uncharacterized protein [Acropora muricata]|uniref:uncharacterized protein n=1 Tax=Acropora muricata TaxID=159855 RepID=UPI0034E3F6F1